MKISLLSLFLLYLSSPIWPIGENPIIGDPFVIVNVATKELAYVNEGEIQEVHKVAIGKMGDETPLGNFQIIVKAANPYYRKKDIPGGDPTNPLGPRWIGFDAKETDGRTFGIHGTNRPDSIGYAVTSGCIRLPNDIVESLYERIPLGTKIHITNEKKRTFDEIGRFYGAIN